MDDFCKVSSEKLLDNIESACLVSFPVSAGVLRPTEHVVPGTKLSKANILMEMER